MYYLAVCNDEGICYGFLKANNTVTKNPDADRDNLMCFKKKSDANSKAMQINLGHLLLPHGADFRVAVVKC